MHIPVAEFTGDWRLGETRYAPNLSYKDSLPQEMLPQYAAGPSARPYNGPRPAREPRPERKLLAEMDAQGYEQARYGLLSLYTFQDWTVNDLPDLLAGLGEHGLERRRIPPTGNSFFEALAVADTSGRLAEVLGREATIAAMRVHLEAVLETKADALDRAGSPPWRKLPIRARCSSWPGPCGRWPAPCAKTKPGPAGTPA